MDSVIGLPPRHQTKINLHFVGDFPTGANTSDEITFGMGSHAVRRLVKTKRHTRDLDQVKQDLKNPRHLAQHKESKAAEDLPGLGSFYCVECAKYFSDSHNLNEHRRGKGHKRRVRALKVDAHSQKMAEAAVGLGTDNGRKG